MIQLNNPETYRSRETLAICDLDKAIEAKDARLKDSTYKHNDHTQICLLGQFTKRITGMEVAGSTSCDAALIDNPNHYRIHVGPEISELVMMFDQSYQYDDPYYLAKLRRSLPMEVDVLVEPARI